GGWAVWKERPAGVGRGRSGRRTGDREAAGGGERVRGASEAVDRGTDVGVVERLPSIEQGLRGDDREQRNDDLPGHDRPDGNTVSSNLILPIHPLSSRAWSRSGTLQPLRCSLCPGGSRMKRPVCASSTDCRNGA